MDRYVAVRKPGPYPLRTKPSKHPLSSSSAITKHLLSTLSDESNPITHSNIYDRSGRSRFPVQTRRLIASDTVVSATTGHQRGERRTPHGVSAKAYFEERSRKLSRQRENATPKSVLNNVRVYIDGYVSGTTEIEMKRIITQAGGTTLYVPQLVIQFI